MLQHSSRAKKRGNANWLPDPVAGGPHEGSELKIKALELLGRAWLRQAGRLGAQMCRQPAGLRGEPVGHFLAGRLCGCGPHIPCPGPAFRTWRGRAAGWPQCPRSRVAPQALQGCREPTPRGCPGGVQDLRWPLLSHRTCLRCGSPRCPTSRRRRPCCPPPRPRW